MEIIVDASAMKAAVKKLSLTAYKKATLPMCRNIHMEAKKSALILAVTDANLVRYLCLRAEVQEEGCCAVDCDKLGKILASAKKPVVTISADDDNVKVESGIKITLPAEKWEDMETIRPVNDKKETAHVAFKDGMLQSAISQVEWSLPRKDAHKPNMECVAIDLRGENPVAVCTDARTMAWKEMEGAEIVLPGADTGIVPEKLPMIPGYALDAIKSMTGSITLTVFGDILILKTGAEDYIRTKLTPGNFPDYWRVIPQDPKYKLSLEENLRKGLKDYQKLLKSMEAKDEKVYLTFSDESTKFSYHAEGVHVEDEVPLQAEFSGIYEGFEVLLDLGLLMPLLNAHKEMPVCGVNDAENPIRFDYPDGYSALLMPCRTK